MSWRVGIMASNGLAFLFWGASLLATPAMAVDFERFGLTSFRTMIGVLELLGGLGVLVGLRYHGLARAAAAGLCLLMLCGVLVRLRAGDGAVQATPAALLCAVNAWIAVGSRA